MTTLPPYEPVPEDLVCFRRNLEVLLKDGGLWSMPGLGLVYRVDRARKALVLVQPAWDATPLTLFGHHHNSYICQAVGWQCLPAVDWEAAAVPE